MPELSQTELDEILIDHSKSPRCQAEINQPTKTLSLKNPLCGDKIEIKLKIESDKIKEIQVLASGCLLSRVSASIMAEKIKSMKLEEALSFADDFILSIDNKESLKEQADEMTALYSISSHPMRQRCLTLAWECFKDDIN